MNIKRVKLVLAIVIMATSLLFAFQKADTVLAATVTTCSLGSTCAPASGATIQLTAIAKDEDGVPIVGVPVKYDWNVEDAGLGYFVADAGNTCNNISPNVCTLGAGGPGTVAFSETNHNTGSIVKFKVLLVSTDPKRIKVTVTYPVSGGISLSGYITLTPSCGTDPVLYYGIGEVADSGGNNWHKSTAEVLDTCRVEYIMYGPDAQRFNK